MWNKNYNLYPYQMSAALTMCSRNVLLAYEMGTGKTPTTLWAIEQLREEQELTGTGIVVVPSSLKYQWADEIRKFTDQNVMVIDGPPKKRYDQYQITKSFAFGYMVVSYDAIVRDWTHIQSIGATAFLVLDEATAIKSFTTKRSKHLKKIAGEFDVRYALTGTPIENGKLEELFSIMEFVDRRVLGRWPKFEAAFIRRNHMGWIDGYKNVGKVHERLSSTRSMPRASHKDKAVAKYLPKVVEPPPIKVVLSNRSQKVNDLIEDRIMSDLDSFVDRITTHLDMEAMERLDWDHPDGRMMAKITVLRQFLSNPESLGGSASPFVDELIEDGLLTPTPMADKLSVLYQYLDDFLTASEQNKGVVFTSFVHTALTIHSNYPNSVVLTGAMSASDRQRSIAQFKEDPATALFVSTDAGGYGLDLPQANLLVNFDLPWSPGTLAQRNARIKRASSLWDYVVVQNIVAADTIEERMLAMLQHKMSLADAVVDGTGMDENGQVQSDLESLRKFLNEKG